VYHENTSSVITEVPFKVMIGVVVSMENVAQVLFPAESVTTNIFVHSFVIGSPLLYPDQLSVAVAEILSANIIDIPVV
jgi:hypothetical protein